jgi:hypothetical protein
MVSGQTSRLEVVSGSLCRAGADVRFGSEADIASPRYDVRFTPKSGHCRPTVECPLCAKSGHWTTFTR